MADSKESDRMGTLKGDQASDAGAGPTARSGMDDACSAPDAAALPSGSRGASLPQDGARGGTVTALRREGRERLRVLGCGEPGARPRSRTAPVRPSTDSNRAVRELLIGGFADATGSLAVGYLQHLSTELRWLASWYAQTKEGPHREVAARTMAQALTRLSKQAEAMAALDRVLADQQG